MSISLTSLNSEAVAALRSGDYELACQRFNDLEQYRKAQCLTHTEIHVVYCNWSKALLALADAREQTSTQTGSPSDSSRGDSSRETPSSLRSRALALSDAALAHVESSLARLLDRFIPSRMLCLLRKGEALLALGRAGEAVDVCEAALKVDPEHERLSALLQRAHLAVLQRSAVKVPVETAATTTDLDGSWKGSGSARTPPTSSRSDSGSLVPMDVHVRASSDSTTLSTSLLQDGSQISLLPSATPFHRLATDALALQTTGRLPCALLNPRQAEGDPALKEALNFAVIRTDLTKPKGHLYGYLNDGKRLEMFARAIKEAVERVEGEAMDPRVLHIGAGCGVLSVAALQSGARHVTAVDRWLYLAKASKDVLEENGCDPGAYRVVLKKPTELKLHSDLPVPCNVLLLDSLLEPSLLLSGLLPSVNHILSERLLVPDAISIPLSVTVYAQPVSLCNTMDVAALGGNANDQSSGSGSEAENGLIGGGISMGGNSRIRLDLSSAPLGANAYLPLGGTPLAVPHSPGTLAMLRRAVTPLGEPQELWTFELTKRNETAGRTEVTMTAAFESTDEGRFPPQGEPGLEPSREKTFDAVLVFYKLQLTKDLAAFSWAPDFLSARPLEAIDDSSVLPSLGGACLFPLPPAAPTLLVEPGASLSFVASHNCVRMAFEPVVTPEATVLRPSRPTPDPRTPPSLGLTLYDRERFRCYSESILSALSEHQNERLREEGPDANAQSHNGPPDPAESPVVLDLASGSGVLGLLAAKSPLSPRLLQCDLLEPVCNALRKSAAVNSVLPRTTVIHRDLGMLKLGAGIPLSAPPTLCLVDGLFDSGLTGLNIQSFLRQLETKSVLEPECRVLPARGTLYCVGLEVLLPPTPSLSGQGPISLEPMRRFLWSGNAYDTVHLAQIPHRVLTRPVKVTELSFAPGSSSTFREGFLKMDAIAEGTLNAMALWFELDMDGHGTRRLLSAPKSLLQSLHGGTLPPTLAAPSSFFAESFGQGLFYLDRSLPGLHPGASFTLLARREAGARVSFHLRPGLGDWVPRAEWLEEWGGGVSVENPHVQRAKYLELLMGEFLQRAKTGRFTAVEEELRVLAAHCGSLQLDPWEVDKVLRELVLVEAVQRDQRFGGAASIEALMPATHMNLTTGGL